jgi:chemotaxis protein methyltransferase CheR
MTRAQNLEPILSDLAGFVAATLGLHFPPERYADLRRGFTCAAREFGFDDARACADWLLAQGTHPGRIQVLARHLTVGETYFFRDRPALDALAEQMLPALLRARRGRDQRLRLWSAACCTGEEAYTLAILLHRLLPDLRDWRITVMATDVNTDFLRKAERGRYGEWSFRDAPGWLKPRYFRRDADGAYTIIPEIRKMVDFACLNLVDGPGACDSLDIGAMDIIFCRNALMYFTESQMARAVGLLHDRLAPGGWLAVSPSEASKALFPRFAPVYQHGAILFRKDDGAAPLMATEGPVQNQAYVPRQSCAGSKRFAQAQASVRSPAAGAHPVRDSAAPSLRARSLANQGRLADALLWCDRWLAQDKLDAAGHYLRAVVLMELGETEQARDSLRRVVYLDGDFILAHFALGNLARERGNDAESRIHYANARRLLRRYRSDEVLPHSEGLSAGRFAQALESMCTEAKAA